MTTPLLRVEGLAKYFPLRKGWLGAGRGAVHAVDGVSFQLNQGETLGLVGESGCGKSTLGKAILRLIEPDAGTIWFRDEDVLLADGPRLRTLRRNMQMIFQDPFSSLNPRMKVGAILAEPFGIHRLATDAAARDRAVADLLEMVGLPLAARERFPHEFSGGQRQRIGIARSLALSPQLIIADEPVSALDVSIQSQILNLLKDLKERLNLTMIFIAHDLAVVEFISDFVAVMYLGRIVEFAKGRELYEHPLHPYTQALIAAIPQSSVRSSGKRSPAVLDGDVPNPAAPPSGCAFHPRCPRASERCRTELPILSRRGAVGDAREVACHHV